MSRGKCGLLLLVLALLPVPILEGAPFVVKLANGTDPAAGVKGAVVKLFLPHPVKGRERVSQTVESGNSARFEIEETPAFISVEFQGGDYYFDGPQVKDATEIGPLEIFLPTEDAASLSFRGQMIMILPHDGESVAVFESLRIENSSDRAYIGERVEGGDARRSLVLTLPNGATEFEAEISGFFGLPERMAVGKEVVVADVTIPPGVEAYSYHYFLPADSGRVRFEKKIREDTEQVVVYLRGEGELEVEGFERSEEIDPHTRERLVICRGTNIPSETRLAVKVEALLEEADGGSREGEEDRDYRWIWVLGGLAVGTTLAFFASLRPRAGIGSGPRSALREFLIEEIARLDLDHDAGRIPDDYHVKKRQILMKRLLGES